MPTTPGELHRRGRVRARRARLRFRTRRRSERRRGRQSRRGLANAGITAIRRGGLIGDDFDRGGNPGMNRVSQKRLTG